MRIIEENKGEVVNFESRAGGSAGKHVCTCSFVSDLDLLFLAGEALESFFASSSRRRSCLCCGLSESPAGQRSHSVSPYAMAYMSTCIILSY